MQIGVGVSGFGLHELEFVGSDVGEDVTMDVIDLHFVQDIDGVAVGGVYGRFEDNVEPCGVGAALLVEKDGANIGKIGGFSGLRVEAFVVINFVVLAEEEGNDGGRSGGGRVAVCGQVQTHGGGLVHGGGEDEEGDEEEAEINHGRKVDTGGEFFGFLYTPGFAVCCGSRYFGHGKMVLE